MVEDRPLPGPQLCGSHPPPPKPILGKTLGCPARPEGRAPAKVPESRCVGRKSLPCQTYKNPPVNTSLELSALEYVIPTPRPRTVLMNWLSRGLLTQSGLDGCGYFCRQ